MGVRRCKGLDPSGNGLSSYFERHASHPSTLALSALFLLAGPVVAGGVSREGHRERGGSARLRLPEAEHLNHRKIGKVAILVRDAKGRVVYSEEGRP